MDDNDTDRDHDAATVHMSHTIGVTALTGLAVSPALSIALSKSIIETPEC